MNFSLKIFFLFFTPLLFALEVEKIRSVQIDLRPSYFFKVSADGNFLSYTLPKNQNEPAFGGNNILHEVLTDKTNSIPGPWDPVFSPDAKIMVLPIQNVSELNYGFYFFDELLQETKTKEIYYDSSLRGYYQSVGLLKKLAEDLIVYRVITERPAGHLLRDYIVDFTRRTIQPYGDLKLLCSSEKIKLPMMSKDGRFLGGLDIRSGYTTIYFIEENGNCSKVIDLGIKTGKVNFSYDNKWVTYHLYPSTISSQDDNYIPNPDDYKVSNIFVFNITDKKHYQLTKNSKSNSLYPDFLMDGSVVYAHYPHEETKTSFEFIRIIK